MPQAPILVWIFTHEVDYEGIIDLQIFSSISTAMIYGNKYKEWHEQFKDLSWGIKDNVYKYRVQYQTLNIASYLVDEALYR